MQIFDILKSSEASWSDPEPDTTDEEPLATPLETTLEQIIDQSMMNLDDAAAKDKVEPTTPTDAADAPTKSISDGTANMAPLFGGDSPSVLQLDPISASSCAPQAGTDRRAALRAAISVPSA